MRDDDGATPGLSGTASAFGRGWDSAGGKGKKPKTPKGKKKSGDDTTLSNVAGAIVPSTSFQSATPLLGSRKKGGHIKKTGLYMLHKNEYVVPAQKRSSKRASRKRTITKH